MTLKEAIEILTHLKAATNSASRHKCGEAYQLLIKAGEREMLFRERVPKKEWSLLPGETEG